MPSVGHRIQPNECSDPEVLKGAGTQVASTLIEGAYSPL